MSNGQIRLDLQINDGFVVGQGYPTTERHAGMVNTAAPVGLKVFAAIEDEIRRLDPQAEIMG
ncbi:hypothetical protein [Nesterenkonia flava]|uniref:Uncharacterized protein n=1 Tax=Nesterenkonia flava TaxID=469799 RepID=A0ABU1FQV1_9MICC|nr:hypothetical protein [Nesterenkonia flava]MDR5710993.1 hypothetical protein [Nesterenkonia flava]